MTRQEIVPERLAGATAVVIDVFMATTTLLTILESGARRVFPVESVEEAEVVGAKLDAASLLRGGEQNAERVEGYDHGPFPEEYPPETVRDRDVIFVTTNGTRAVADAAPADRLLVGCLRNAPAVARHLEACSANSVYLVCAGAAGRFTVEDFLGAATIMSHMDARGWRLNDAAWVALDFVERRGGEILDVLERGRAGRWFIENDRMETMRFVADIGASDTVPEVANGLLRRARPASRQLRVDCGTPGGGDRADEPDPRREGRDAGVRLLDHQPEAEG